MYPTQKKGELRLQISPPRTENIMDGLNAGDEKKGN